MRDEVIEALAIDRSSSVDQRTIDITTTGRRSGEPRRIEIWFYRFEDSIYLSGTPGRRTRDWLANLAAEPHFIFHLKHPVVADLAAAGTVITDVHERRRILAAFVDEFNDRHSSGHAGPTAVPDEWVESSPVVKVRFLQDDSVASPPT